MTNHQSQITNIQWLFNSDRELQQLMQQSLHQAAVANPHWETNPVRTLDDWYLYIERFAHSMPWQAMDIGEDATFFRRIDQNIGYFYFLIDQPLEALKNRGYIYPSLQYEPRVAQWLVDYNKAWGEWLSSADSWNDTYYNLARADARFELNTNRYESPANWHSWNDFFARKLNHKSPITNLSRHVTASSLLHRSRQVPWIIGLTYWEILRIKRFFLMERRLTSSSMCLIIIVFMRRVTVQCSNAKSFRESMAVAA